MTREVRESSSHFICGLFAPVFVNCQLYDVIDDRFRYSGRSVITTALAEAMVCVASRHRFLFWDNSTAFPFVLVRHQRWPEAPSDQI